MLHVMLVVEGSIDTGRVLFRPENREPQILIELHRRAVCRGDRKIELLELFIFFGSFDQVLDEGATDAFVPVGG